MCGSLVWASHKNYCYFSRPDLQFLKNHLQWWFYGFLKKIAGVNRLIGDFLKKIAIVNIYSGDS